MTAAPAFTRPVPGCGSGPTTIPTENVLERISRTFEAHAVENSLDRHGFKCAFARLVGSVPSRLEVAHVFGSREGGEEERSVPREIFERYMASRIEESDSYYSRRSRADAAFRAFDRSNAGYVTLDDALAAFRAAAGETIAREVVEEVFAEADVNGDGKVTADEFAAVFLAGERRE
jgi:Ca2+-binding EF-hand superfamily protein